MQIVLLEHNYTDSFIYVSSTAAFMVQSWIAAAEMVWPTKPNYLLSGRLPNKLANSY